MPRQSGRVVRVSRSVCLRLDNVGRGRLGLRGDQIYVGGTERQGHQQLFDKVTDRTQSGSRRSCNARRFAAGDHDRSSAKVFLFIDALFVNRGAVESNRNKGIAGTSDNLTLRHRLYDALSGCG